MIGWYELWALVVLVLWIFASPRDRSALLIVLIAAIVGEAVKFGITIHIERAWKLVAFNATEEALTLLALYLWAKNRTGYLQGICVSVALATLLVNFAGIELGLIQNYGRYVVIIELVAIAQLLAFYDTILYNLRRLGRWLESFRLRTGAPVHAGCVRSRLLPDPRSPRLQTLPRP